MGVSSQSGYADGWRRGAGVVNADAFRSLQRKQIELPIRKIVEKARREAYAGAPAVMVALYVAVEAEHILAGHDSASDAQSCDPCVDAVHATWVRGRNG